jgi:hypothetical protein
MGIENGPFSFTLEHGDTIVSKKRDCQEKGHRRWEFRAALVGTKKSLEVSRKTEKMALGWGAGQQKRSLKNVLRVNA